MPKMTCRRCRETFEYDENDIRPYIYHECKDGCLTAHDNPNNKKTSKPYYHHNHTTTKKKHTLWQNFG